MYYKFCVCVRLCVCVCVCVSSTYGDELLADDSAECECEGCNKLKVCFVNPFLASTLAHTDLLRSC